MYYLLIKIIACNFIGSVISGIFGIFGIFGISGILNELILYTKKAGD